VPVAQSIAVYPGRWALAFLFALMLLPGFDIPVSGFFYQPETTFHWTVGGVPELIRRAMPETIIASVIVCAVLWLGTRFSPAWPRWITGRHMAYLVATLLIGPGLIVESILKPVWGRARPKDITVFGGEAAYTWPWIPAQECVGNCSFASGHAAIAFWVTAYAFILPAAWRARALFGAVVFGLLMGLVRIAQGGHFLSDIVAAGFVVLLVNEVLARVILKPGPP